MINEELESNLSNKTLDKLAENSSEHSFRVRKIDTNEYKFLAKISIGTIIIKGYPGLIDGISIHAKVQNNNKSDSIVHFSTKPRLELVVTLAIWLTFILVQIIESGIPIWVTTALFPIMIVWMAFVYRLQENRLLKKVKEEIIRPTT